MRLQLFRRLTWLLSLVAAGILVLGLVTAPTRGVNRVEVLASRLRCPVCQSESVADSPSETARAITEIIAQQVEDGRSDEEIIAFFVARYGEWIVIDAPPRGATLTLWILPPTLLLVGTLILRSKRRPRDPSGRHRPDANVSSETV